MRHAIIVTVFFTWYIAPIAFAGHAAAQSAVPDGPCSYPPEQLDWGAYETVSAEMSPPRTGRRFSAEPPRTSPENSPPGTVIMHVAIGDTGKIKRAQIVHSLTCDLDKEAIAFFEDYQFYPARKDGKSVASQIDVEVSFKNKYPLASYDGVYRVGNGVSAPRAIEAPDPRYTKAARQAKIEGTVLLWLVVNSQGRPEHITIAKSLEPGLDQEAIEAVKQWRFEPSMKDSQPVATMINIEINYKLK